MLSIKTILLTQIITMWFIRKNNRNINKLNKNSAILPKNSSQVNVIRYVNIISMYYKYRKLQ